MSLRRTMTMRKVAKTKKWNKMITTMKKSMMRTIKSKSKSTLVAILIIWTGWAFKTFEVGNKVQINQVERFGEMTLWA